MAGRGRRRRFWRIVDYERGGGNLGGPNILSLLENISLCGCKRLGKIFADKLRYEAGRSGVTSRIDGRGLCCYE